ncbi:hypothetical protein XENOCAPTIV_005865, partial [Xenoophorus captivus]
KPEPVVQKPDRPAWSEEQIERKSKSIIDEFLHINDYKVTLMSVICRTSMYCWLNEVLSCRLIHQAPMNVICSVPSCYTFPDELVFMIASHFSPGGCPVCGRAELGLSVAHLCADRGGVHPGAQSDHTGPHGPTPLPADTLELADDMAIDIPHIWLYLAELLSPLLKDGGFSMRELFSHRNVGSLWRESGLNWADLLPEEEDVEAFISQQFLQSEGSSSEEVQTKRILSPEELSQQLEKLLLEDMASDEQIFDWVEASSSPFLRALMTAVCKAAVKDLLRMFFDCLYDEDVISEDAFYKWESSKDPAEQQGKGVALKSVTAFFTWLREAEEESEDN